MEAVVVGQSGEPGVVSSLLVTLVGVLLSALLAVIFYQLRRLTRSLDSLTTRVNEDTTQTNDRLEDLDQRVSLVSQDTALIRATIEQSDVLDFVDRSEVDSRPYDWRDPATVDWKAADDVNDGSD